MFIHSGDESGFLAERAKGTAGMQKWPKRRIFESRQRGKFHRKPPQTPYLKTTTPGRPTWAVTGCPTGGFIEEEWLHPVIGSHQVDGEVLTIDLAFKGDPV